MLVKVIPSELICHCTVSAGLPTAAAVSETLLPALTTWLAGLTVTMGEVATVNVAGVVVAVPAEFMKTAWYSLPFWPAFAVRVRVVEIAFVMLLKVFPPSVLTCHCTLGAGMPMAAATRETLLPAPTTWFVGLLVTAGACGVGCVSNWMFKMPPEIAVGWAGESEFVKALIHGWIPEPR